MPATNDPAKTEWGIQLNEPPAPATPELPWADLHERQKSRQPGLVLWNKATRQVIRLSGSQALSLLDGLRQHLAWQQEGVVVGEPVWLLSLDKPHQKATISLTNPMTLSPEQAQALYDLLTREEQTLQRMKAEEEAERGRVLANIYRLILNWHQEEQHPLYNEALSRAESKRILRQRWEQHELPRPLSRADELLLTEVLQEISQELVEKARQGPARARRIKRNLSAHHFFWARLKTVWPQLMAAERLHILQQLQDVEWNQQTVADIRQLLENAQFFDRALQKAGTAPEPLTSEEINLLLDLPDEALRYELLDLYRQKPAVQAST